MATYDLQDAMSVAEFFSTRGVEKKNRTFHLSPCISKKTGEKFTVLRLRDGGQYKDAYGNMRPSSSSFALSKKLSATEELNEDFLHEHKEEIRVLPRKDDPSKIGVIFLAVEEKLWEKL